MSTVPDRDPSKLPGPPSTTQNRVRAQALELLVTASVWLVKSEDRVLEVRKADVGPGNLDECRRDLTPSEPLTGGGGTTTR